MTQSIGPSYSEVVHKDAFHLWALVFGWSSHEFARKERTFIVQRRRSQRTLWWTKPNPNINSLITFFLKVFSWHWLIIDVDHADAAVSSFNGDDSKSFALWQQMCTCVCARESGTLYWGYYFLDNFPRGRRRGKKALLYFPRPERRLIFYLTGREFFKLTKRTL